MTIHLSGQPARSSRRVWLRTHARIRLGERTTLNRKALQELLHARQYVPLGLVEPGVRALLVYSEPDDCCFVILQDFHTGNVVTVLPLDYWKGGELTENSAEAWKARNLALAEGKCVATDESGCESSCTSREEVCGQADASTQKSLKVRQTRLALLAVLTAREDAALAELTQAYGSAEQQTRITDERFYRLAGALEDVDVAESLMGKGAGRGRAGWLVLTLLRDPPEFELRVPRALLHEEISAQLEQPAFIAHIARKLVGRALLNEDVLGFHILVGPRRYDFPAAAQRAFLEACASTIAAAWPHP